MNIRVLHIAIHMGGGAGKAISGICINTKKYYNNTIILLEKPVNTTYIEILKENNISVYIAPCFDEIIKLIKCTDVVIINWWGHPLMIKFLQNFPSVYCRCVIWNHVNGCTYPYLPAIFLQSFMGIMFTTKYSLYNTYWNDFEIKNILDKSTVVYGMGDFNPNKIIPKRVYEHKDRFIIGYIGTIDYAKINRRFLDYYREIIKEIPNIQICMLGAVSKDIQKEITDSGLEEYFLLPGYVDSIETYIRNFDVFAYLLAPDNYATTENALLEAMAYGIPVIVLNNDVEKYIVKDGVNGFLVNNIGEFVNKVKDLYDKDIAENIGKSARNFVIKEYSISENVQRYCKICDRALNSEKVLYDFKEIIGNSGYDAFMFFSQNEGNFFSDYTSDINTEIKPIFKGLHKGSIYQYLEYFSDDTKLNKLADFLHGSERNR